MRCAACWDTSRGRWGKIPHWCELRGQGWRAGVRQQKERSAEISHSSSTAWFLVQFTAPPAFALQVASWHKMAARAPAFTSSFMEKGGGQGWLSIFPKSSWEALGPFCLFLTDQDMATTCCRGDWEM